MDRHSTDYTPLLIQVVDVDGEEIADEAYNQSEGMDVDISEGKECLPYILPHTSDSLMVFQVSHNVPSSLRFMFLPCGCGHALNKPPNYLGGGAPYLVKASRMLHHGLINTR